MVNKEMKIEDNECKSSMIRILSHAVGYKPDRILFVVCGKDV